MHKDAIKKQIEEMETKIQQTEDDLVGQRSAFADALRVVLPMQKDTLQLLREVFEFAVFHSSDPDA